MTTEAVFTFLDWLKRHLLCLVSLMMTVCVRCAIEELSTGVENNTTWLEETPEVC